MEEERGVTMTEHPIIFTAESIRAILDDRKTQTRRVAKLPSEWHRGYGAFENNPHGDEEIIIYGECDTKSMYCPYGSVGDTLWVRETWRMETFTVDHTCRTDSRLRYKAEDERIFDVYGQVKLYKWKSPIHMPKQFARVFLEITGIRVERVQDISEEDAKAEGVGRFEGRDTYSYAVTFSSLWNSLNAKRGYPWESNPWNWVIEFKKKEVKQ